jgi:hypothetical protein
MLKLITPLALAALTIISIAPNSEAMSANIRPLSVGQPGGDLHAQVIIKFGDRGYSRRAAAQRRRELEREREAARRRQYRRYRNDYRRSR